MNTLRKPIPVYYLAIGFLMMVLGISGCSSKCPPDGKWRTDETQGLIGFEVSSCQVILIVVSIDESELSNRYGSSFAQDYVNKNGSMITNALFLECPIDRNGKFACQAYAFSGEFLSDSEASGELILPMGFEFQLGFRLKKPYAITYEWSATPLK